MRTNDFEPLQTNIRLAIKQMCDYFLQRGNFDIKSKLFFEKVFVRMFHFRIVFCLTFEGERKIANKQPGRICPSVFVFPTEAYSVCYPGIPGEALFLDAQTDLPEVQSSLRILSII